jgi:hypothetical protein
MFTHRSASKVNANISSTTKTHLNRGAFVMFLLLTVCVIPFVLGQEQVRAPSKQKPTHRSSGAPAAPSGAVYQTWVARYNPPWNTEDDANAIAVDDQGSVYVTGRSWGLGGNYDYATVKYSSAGQQEWVARYNGPDDRDDEPEAMAIDAFSNVYVTGSTQAADSYSDWAIIKYNSAGHQLWLVRHNVCPRSYALAKAIAVDGSGNAYVTGTDADGWGTIKYNSVGEEQWVVHYSSGTPEAIALDNVGNVYVTGGDSDYVTIKYDPAGQQQWVARYHGPGKGSNHANAMVIDSSAKVYVTGASAGSNGAPDYATIKYNSAGQQQWAARYDGPAGSTDQATAIGVDGAGDVYVTGSSVGLGTLYDYATVKYDSTGQQQWVQRYNGPAGDQDGATSMAVDTSGNAYVTGYARVNQFSTDYATIKYDSSGQEQWVARYNGPGNGDDYARAIALDSSGNVYVTGNSLGLNTIYDYATIKYGQGPTPTPTPTATASPTATAIATPTPSATASPSPTVVCSPTPTVTSSPTQTPSEPPCPPCGTPTGTATFTPTPPPFTPTPTATTPQASATPTITPGVTPTPSDCPAGCSPTPTPSPTPALRGSATPRARPIPPPRP